MSDQSFNVFNVFKQALKPHRLMVMIRKVVLRMKGGHEVDVNYLQWLKDNLVDLDSFAKKIDADLWYESLDISSKIKEDAHKSLSKINYDLGGGGCIPLLYFLVRKICPDVLVETGVAAGFSSYAMLAAIEKNNKGTLYSSDFPYFRIRNPEKFIGCIVPNRFKKENWKLYIEGDKNNLSLILSEVEKVDFIHYDSDKSYDGRSWVLDRLRDYFSESTVVVMDDIQDNNFFYDYINQNKIKDWKIFTFEGKYLGMAFVNCSSKSKLLDLKN